MISIKNRIYSDTCDMVWLQFSVHTFEYHSHSTLAEQTDNMVAGSNRIPIRFRKALALQKEFGSCLVVKVPRFIQFTVIAFSVDCYPKMRWNARSFSDN